MPVIQNPLIDEKSDFYALAKSFYFDLVGYDYIPNGVLAHMGTPDIGKAALNLMFAVLSPAGKVSTDLKMLLANMTSYAVGCTYCHTNTFEAAQNMSVHEEKLAKMWEYRTNPLFSDADRAALEFALATATSPVSVTDELRDNLKSHFDQTECAEIMATIAAFAYFQKWNDSNGTLLEQHVIDIANKHLVGSGHLDEKKFAVLARK